MSDTYRAAIIVCSDRASHGTYEDKAGPAAFERLEAMGFSMRNPVHVVPDDPAKLRESLDQAIEGHDLIVVSGGTGISPRDITPQTLDKYADYGVPGIGEFLRHKSFQFSNNAYLSRCGAWVRAGTLIVALPGNPRAVCEQLDILGTMLKSSIDAVKGTCKHRHRTQGTEHHD